MIPCYVSGKGMHATQTTWDFKTHVIELLESSKLGFDTRYAYYQKQFPNENPQELARKVCDPIEYYDKDWPPFLEKHKHEKTEQWLITEFMLERDDQFRDQAQAAIYCFDEAGFGSGVNVMRFLTQNKPLIGFYRSDTLRPHNINNVMQLKLSYPDLVTLYEYDELGFILNKTEAWLRRFT